MSRQAMLDKDPIRPLFFKYYFPALISILSVTLHQVINGIILGQYVGKNGPASVGLYGSVLLLFVALSLPVMIGGGIIISRSIGEKNYDKAQLVFCFATTLGLVVGGVIAFSTPLFIHPLVDFLAGDKSSELVGFTGEYISWQLYSLPFFFVRMFWGNFLRSDSSQVVARNASIFAVVLNIVLDLALIVGLDMGVEGASIATAVSIAGGTGYQFLYIKKGKNHFGFKHFSFTLRLPFIKDLLMYGLPSFASEVAFAMGLLFINRAVLPYGASTVAAFSSVNYISFIFIRLFTSAMIAVLPIISYNIGAGLYSRVLATVRFGVVFTTMLGVVVAVIGLLVPGLMIDAFSGDVSDEYKQLAESAIGLYFILFMAAGPNYILSAYLQSIGKTTLSVMLNVLKGFLLIALFLAVLPGMLGLDGVWLSRSLAEVFTLLLVSGYMLMFRTRYFSQEAIARKES